MRKGVKFVEPDFVDDYVTAVEEFQQAMSAADGTARLVSVGDYSSFAVSDVGDDDQGSYLEQSRGYVIAARDALASIVEFLSVVPVS